MNLLKPEEVASKLGITKTSLPNLRRRETTFPKPIRVSERILRWNEEEIDQWLTNRKEPENAQNK